MGDMTALPHLLALVSGIAPARLRRLWQQDFAHRLTTDMDWRQRALALDRVLAELDPAARQTLLAMVLDQIDLRNPKRGWVQAFDLLNQARAHLYLARAGCHGISFLPGASTGKTPDLIAENATGPVLCEVKTLHFSAPATPPGSARRLALRLLAAAAQLRVAEARAASRRIAYICLDFPAADFSPADMAQHMDALTALAAGGGFGAIEIVFDCGPSLCDTGGGENREATDGVCDSL